MTDLDSLKVLRELGAPAWFLTHMQRLMDRGCLVAVHELVAPLVLDLGYQAAVNKRLTNKVLQQERELAAKDRRIDGLVKRQRDWEGTNYNKNRYIGELKDYIQKLSKAQIDAPDGASLQALYYALKNVRYGEELQASYYAQRPMGMGCKVPEPEQPYVRYQDKKSWAIGDRVRITEDLAGTVRHISYGERLGTHTVGILTDTKGGVQTTHWLIRKSLLHSLEYRGQYTTQVQK